MAKELILMADVDGLGVEGEIVKVADGYARNFLLPQKKAVAVTAGTKRLVEKKKAERIAREAASLKEAQDLAAQVEKLAISLPVKAGESGQMYGSIGAADILAALEKEGFKFSRKQIELSAPIRSLGTVDVPVKLHAEVSATLKVTVVEE